MGFIEGVFCEILHFLVNLPGNIFWNPFRHRTWHGHVAIRVFFSMDEHFAFSVHDIAFLFRHRAAYQIASSHRKASQIAKDLHDLLLINHTAVSHVQNRF